MLWTMVVMFIELFSEIRPLWPNKYWNNTTAWVQHQLRMAKTIRSKVIHS